VSFTVNGLNVPESNPDLSFSNDILYDFEIPGSTHDLRLSNPVDFSLVNSDNMAFFGKRSYLFQIQACCFFEYDILFQNRKICIILYLMN